MVDYILVFFELVNMISESRGKDTPSICTSWKMSDYLVGKAGDCPSPLFVVFDFCNCCNCLIKSFVFA